ncbi:hypothetical protein BRADI_3g54587v3 [Brachypodium distachyon]|uniref:Uncharacterized protein n=1 Tax=Brachypodium distachyon TaxID=15368 RepID=A0A2K2D537_BRADI|nr:hypothetical protein BRADI_3g54587v3 [Brachypodium distachyon]
MGYSSNDLFCLIYRSKFLKAHLLNAAHYVDQKGHLRSLSQCSFLRSWSDSRSISSCGCLVEFDTTRKHVGLGQRSGENGIVVVDVQLEGCEIGHRQLHARQP